MRLGREAGIRARGGRSDLEDAEDRSCGCFPLEHGTQLAALHALMQSQSRTVAAEAYQRKTARTAIRREDASRGLTSAATQSCAASKASTIKKE